MKPQVAPTPTVPTPPMTACPRWNGDQILGFAVNTDSLFEWHECEDYAYLWAIPRGWTPHSEPRKPESGG